MKELTSQNVLETFSYCLFRQEETEGLSIDEIKAKAVLVEGIVQNYGLNPERLEESRPTIVEYIQQIHPNFMEEGTGGGWSFLNLPFDKDGKQWGEHHNAEQLYVLANAVGLAKFQMPRNMWNILPGNMPYIVFRLTTEK